MTTPLPYGRQSIDEDDVASVAEVLRSDWLTTGPAVDAFEAALSEVSGGHPVVAVNSGTAALHAAYAAVGVGPGSNIVTSPLTFAATATAALHLGAEVRLADIDDHTLLIDPQQVARVADEQTRAIVPVDYAGQPASSHEIRAIANDIGAVVIEDASHSIGGSLSDQPVGDLADLTTYSFHPVKTITTGEGGAVVVRDRDFEDDVRRFRNHGLVRDPSLHVVDETGPWHQEVQSLGLNYRMPDVLAALGTSQLSKLAAFVAERRKAVDLYRSLFADIDEVRLVDTVSDSCPAWHLFPIRVRPERRQRLHRDLHQGGIGTQVHYLPLHHQPGLRAGITASDCPAADRAYQRLLSLPLFPGLRDADIRRVVSEVERSLKRQPGHPGAEQQGRV